MYNLPPELNLILKWTCYSRVGRNPDAEKLTTAFTSVFNFKGIQYRLYQHSFPTMCPCGFLCASACYPLCPKLEYMTPMAIFPHCNLLFLSQLFSKKAISLNGHRLDMHWVLLYPCLEFLAFNMNARMRSPF